MTTEPFKIDVGTLKRKVKDQDPAAIKRVDTVAEAHGFVERTPKRRRGRPASPRTGQVHARVLPNVSEEISVESKRRGVQQGVIIEEAWELYCKANTKQMP